MATVAYTTSAASTTLVDDAGAIGSVTLPAGFWTVGKLLRISAGGTINSKSGTPGSVRFDAKLGTVTVLTSSGYTMTASIVGSPWLIEGWLLCTAIGETGTLIGGAYITYPSSSLTTVGFVFPMPTPGVGPQDVVVDTTAEQIFDLVSTFGTSDANNKMWCHSITLIQV